MEKIRCLFQKTVDEDFIQAVLSNPRFKESILKIKVRPVEMKGNRLFQFESFTKTQAFHENLGANEAVGRLCGYMEEFRQAQISVRGMEYTVLVSKKGKVTVKSRVVGEEQKSVDLSHNRSKRYILQEGVPVPFLQDLGVMTQEGKIVRSKSDKFR